MEGAGQDKTIRPHQRADAGVRGPRHTPLAKYEHLCYGTPMKSAASPLLFLGACRITYVPGANHRESPCGRGRGETSPSPTTVRRRVRPVPMPFPDKPLGAIPLSDGYATDERRLRDGSATDARRLVTSCHAFVTAPCLKTPNSADKRDTYNQRTRLRPGVRAVTTVPRRRLPYPAMPRSTDLCRLSLGEGSRS